ncbi:MAG: NAD(P)/FAD-dependent oxidoreductase [Porticoccaceae bacterium]|nr:NAD(P)/FAD-dependent oxidoreductase [Porticoccaceae bacterium]OUS08777.1 ferredoxin--NADP(+) reductase [Gammaproteobacteria bacterium 54_18_T64]
MSEVHTTDVAIIGAGPVGLFSVFQCGMLKMSCHVIDALPATGGQCTALYPEKPLFDIPAAPNINAVDLIARLERQIAPFKPVIHLNQQVSELEKVGEHWHLRTSSGLNIRARAIIIAAGAGAFGPNKPPLNNIDRFEGKSVHYMVQRREDFRDQRIVIAGGGDSAVDWALSLADVAAEVYVIHRRDRFRAIPESVAQMKALADAGKIELVIPYQLAALEGKDDQLKTVIVKTLDGEERRIAADHLLSFFGLASKLGPINDWGLDILNGVINVEPTTCATNVEGIFAVGDIAHYPHKLKLILSGFSEAAQAAHAAYRIVNPGQALNFEHSTTSGIPTLEPA